MVFEFNDARISKTVWRSIGVDENGCWLWAGPTNGDGYARISVGGVRCRAHRHFFTVAVGPIPEGMVIDHACHNEATDCPGGASCLHRRCVNPAHLQAVTSGANVMNSGLTISGRNSSKTHCARGHAFEKDGYVNPSTGHRQCRICATESAAQNRALDRPAFLKSQTDYYAAHREELLAKKKAYDDAHREEKRRKARERYWAKKGLPGPVN